MTDRPTSLSADTRSPLARANDKFRKTVHPASGDWLLTAGVHALGNQFIDDALIAVIRFDDFTPDNDPYGEHDFGSVTLDGHKLFWKIDCYDRTDMTRGSEDPADPTVTRRVMTIMLASEY